MQSGKFRYFLSWKRINNSTLQCDWVRYENQGKSIELHDKKSPQLKIPWIFRKFYFTYAFTVI